MRGARGRGERERERRGADAQLESASEVRGERRVRAEA